MKARNLIPGWPCGRSTIPSPPMQRADEWLMSAGLPHMPIDELKAEQQYHNTQQEMVDDWFERYRNPLRHVSVIRDDAGLIAYMVNHGIANNFKLVGMDRP